MDIQNPDLLFDRALEAAQSDDKQKSIAIIKQAISQAPGDARMHYLLGSLYADLGLYDKAVETIEESLRLDKNYNIARFHLGLLQLLSGKVDQAEQTWLPLDSLDDTHYLKLFKTGMLKIVQDEIDEGVACIKAGINHNTLNESLNQDMAVVLENVAMSTEGE